jgi:chorismate synthase
MTLRFLTAGESHGPALSIILDGFPAGVAVDTALIAAEMQRRQSGFGAGPRMKMETDRVEILSGVMAGVTTGAPIGLIIKNTNHEKWKGKDIPAFTTPRPGHADLTGAVKYGYEDFRPALERASARETAARTAVGAFCKLYLSNFGIRVGGYVCSIGEIDADLEKIGYVDRLDLASGNDLNCPDDIAAVRMRERIRQAMENRDTVGGSFEVVALEVPIGLGSYSQWDKRLDARLGGALLSIPAVKGVEIGPAFENSRLPGTQVHDPISLNGDSLVRSSNRAGGIEGGISSGQPILLHAAMKPIASTLTPQPTVDLAARQETGTVYERSDFCPVPRAVVVAEAMTAFVLADALLEKLGGDSLSEMQPRFDALRKARFQDLPMRSEGHLYWPDQNETENNV